jgi:hypothetical protein
LTSYPTESIILISNNTNVFKSSTILSNTSSIASATFPSSLVSIISSVSSTVQSTELRELFTIMTTMADSVSTTISIELTSINKNTFNTHSKLASSSTTSIASITSSIYRLASIDATDEIFNSTKIDNFASDPEKKTTEPKTNLYCSSFKRNVCKFIDLTYLNKLIISFIIRIFLRPLKKSEL